MKTTTKMGLWITVLSFIAIGVTGNMEKREGGQGEAASGPGKVVAVGSTFAHELDLRVQSAKGYHRVESARGRLKAANGHTVVVSVRGVQERPWPARLTLDPATPDARLLGEPIQVTLSAEIPSDSGLVGQSGELRFTGRVRYLEFIVDEAKAEFNVRPAVHDFDLSVPVSVVAAPDEAVAEDDEKPVTLVQGLLMTSLLAGIGLVLLSLVGGRILITSLVLITVPIIVVTTFYEGAPGKERGGTAARSASGLVNPGEIFGLDPGVGIASVDGYHQITSLSAWLRGIGEEQIELRARTASDKPWPNVIKVRSVRVGPLFKTSREGISALVHATLPPAEQVAGKSATLVVSGVVDYPDIGALDAINPLLSNFDIASQRFRYERDIRFASEEAPPLTKEPEGAPEWMLIPVGIGVFLLVGTILLSIFRKLRG